MSGVASISRYSWRNSSAVINSLKTRISKLSSLGRLNHLFRVIQMGNDYQTHSTWRLFLTCSCSNFVCIRINRRTCKHSGVCGPPLSNSSESENRKGYYLMCFSVDHNAQQFWEWVHLATLSLIPWKLQRWWFLLPLQVIWLAWAAGSWEPGYLCSSQVSLGHSLKTVKTTLNLDIVFLIIFKHVLLLRMCMMYVCVGACRSQRTALISVLAFHIDMVSRDWTQVFRFVGP